MNNFIMGFILGAVLGFVLALVFPAAAADRGPHVAASHWLTLGLSKRANMARAAVKAAYPDADWYSAAVRRYGVMTCMDTVLLDEKMATEAKKRRLFVLLAYCAKRSRGQ